MSNENYSWYSSDEANDILALAAALASGTKLERQSLLVEVAKALGFEEAKEAFWERHEENFNEGEGLVISDPNFYCNYLDEQGDITEIRLGVFFVDSVWPAMVQEGDETRNMVEVFDSIQEAKVAIQEEEENG